MSKCEMNFVLYQGGAFQQVTDDYAPALLRDIVSKAVTEDDKSPDLEEFVIAAGGSLIEAYGCNDEMILVYKVDAFWLVDHTVGADTNARIYVRTLADYLTFQASWVVPMSTKVMQKIGLTMMQEVRNPPGTSDTKH